MHLANLSLVVGCHLPQVQKLQRACLQNPVKVEVSAKYTTVDTLRQQYLFVPAKHKVHARRSACTASVCIIYANCPMAPAMTWYSRGKYTLGRRTATWRTS
jgi:hypothetical protein